MLAIPAMLAPWERCRSENVMLFGVIGGSNPDGLQFQRYLALFERELHELRRGIRVKKYGQPANIVRAGVVAHIMDSRASEKVMLCQAGGASKAMCWCCKCHGRHVKAYNKCVYDDARRFLSARHWMRKHRAWGEKELKAIEPRTKDAYISDGEAHERFLAMPHTRGTQGWQKKYKPCTKTGIKGVPAIARYPGPGFPEAMLFDAMHSFAGLIKNVIRCLVGRGLVKKKTTREELYNEEKTRFSGWDKKKYVKPNWPRTKGPKWPRAPFRLKQAAVQQCVKELASIKLFPGLKPSIRGAFAINTKDMLHGTPGMAEYVNIFSTGLIKILVRSMGKLQRITIGKIADGMRVLWRKKFTIAEGNAASKELLEGLALMLIAFPLWLALACGHYVAHIALQWKKFGPMRGCNCFAVERKLGVMMGLINSRKLPVVCSQ